jgi:hypothetical protein
MARSPECLVRCGGRGTGNLAACAAGREAIGRAGGTDAIVGTLQSADVSTEVIHYKKPLSSAYVECVIMFVIVCLCVA